MKLRVAADLGGTFTDIAFIFPDQCLATRKVQSTPQDYGCAVVEGDPPRVDEGATRELRASSERVAR